MSPRFTRIVFARSDDRGKFVPIGLRNRRGNYIPFVGRFTTPSGLYVFVIYGSCRYVFARSNRILFVRCSASIHGRVKNNRYIDICDLAERAS